MSGIAQPMIFSPQNCSLQQLESTLTPNRRDLGERMIGQISSSMKKAASHNNLIIGPRGSGKTHLMTYVWKSLKAGFGEETGLHVLCLSEEERGLTSFFDFLLACLRAAGIPREDVIGLSREGDAAMRQEAAQNLLLESFAGKPCLIVVENLGDIFNGLEAEALSSMRGFLQGHPSVSLLASSVELYSRSSQPDHPFYGYFNIHPLESLSREEAREYLGMLAASRGDHELAAKLKDDRSRARVNAVYDLTNGNHRLLAMLASFLTAEGLEDLVGPFVQLADRELTPYYQQRLDRLSPQQNKLLRAIADEHGRALSVGEIADISFMSSQTTSRQLYDLLHRGYVDRTQVGRESCYELKEPLLRLVLDIKEVRDKPILPLIVSFLKSWYTVGELKNLLLGSVGLTECYYSAALKEALESEKIVRDALSLQERGTSLIQQNRTEEALAVFDEIIERFKGHGSTVVKTVVATALANRGLLAHEDDRLEEAIDMFESVTRELEAVESPESGSLLVLVCLNKAELLKTIGRHDESLDQFDALLRLCPNEPAALAGRIGVLLRLKREDESLETLRNDLSHIPRSSKIRTGLAAELISAFPVEPNRLLEVIDIFDGDRDSLFAGLLLWIKAQLPLTKERAAGLALFEETLRGAFGDVPEAAVPLQLLNALRRRAEGDRKALLALPLELRRLVESSGK